MAVEAAAVIDGTRSFKEESNLVSELKGPERTALAQLKELVATALANGEFNLPPPAAKEEPKKEEPAKEEAKEEAPAAEPNEELIWGVPLVGDDERTDTVLLKFLRAREFKVKEAMAMLKSAVLWRKRFGIDELLSADLGLPELENVVFYRGTDREGHPVCYNVYGEFQDKDLYGKAFGDEEKRERFLKWRIQLLERGIREQLDFSPRGICSMVQVTDLKNSPLMLPEDRAVTRQVVALLQDNPEFVAKKVFINVPWWYLAVNKVMSPFLTERTKSKFVFCSPGKSAKTLFRYIAPEQVPVQFGGLYKKDDTEFSTSDAVTELTVKPSFKEAIEIPATEAMELNILERVVAGSKEPSHLDLSLLQSITENFSEQRKIGFGGCGNVYKGILRNGDVAVKRLFNNRTIKDKMFHREVQSLITVRHKNIVRFLGYCSFTEEQALIFGGRTIMAEIRERLLCFEYIRNGNLENYLTDVVWAGQSVAFVHRYCRLSRWHLLD